MEENVQQQVTELQIIQAKQAADFAMTPVGQTVKQFEVMQRMFRVTGESFSECLKYKVYAAGNDRMTMIFRLV